MAKGGRTRDKAVKRQYEDYPYPPRNPDDEARRLIEGSPSHLDEINHYLFAGKRDFSKPFRALVAGGGTGDATLMLAQHLADKSDQGTVTYLDLSTASRAVAEARANARGLTNIEFLTGSLLDLSDMGLPAFDYIDCCGVLHHLEDPEKGLQALTDCLADDGGMGIMLYATLGRTGVYPLQSALKALTRGETTAQQVKAAKTLLADLPATNWLLQNKFVGDHQLGEDAALFDLLLHPRDRSYLVPDVLTFIESSSLNLVSFIEPVKYNPDVFLKDPTLIKKTRDLNSGDRAALAENLTGFLKTHIFYVTKNNDPGGCKAKFDPERVPILKNKNPDILADTLEKRTTLDVNFDGHRVSFPVPEGAAEFVSCIDGERQLKDIQAKFSLNWPRFRQRYAPTYKILNELNLMWLG
jgi:SAM-dependent methyltransferase